MINLDTGTAIAFVAEESNLRYQLQSYVKNQSMVMTQTAIAEFRNIVQTIGGEREQQRGINFEKYIVIIPDNPSKRALNLQPTRKLGINDIIILGTGDNLGIVTMTGDAKAIRSASNQGVNFIVYLHQPVPLKGL
ncbi:MAG TPA: DUF1308 domain-containing protein [Cyanothece sp. UBA12306]|nr:DUF1308 domain-containing protein [Cyanothece sp. UBA12306]